MPPSGNVPSTTALRPTARVHIPSQPGLGFYRGIRNGLLLCVPFWAMVGGLIASR
jgi:hypothetical protein